MTAANGTVISFFFSSRRRHTRLVSDWSSDVCSSDLFRHLEDKRLSEEPMRVFVDTRGQKISEKAAVGEGLNEILRTEIHSGILGPLRCVHKYFVKIANHRPLKVVVIREVCQNREWGLPLYAKLHWPYVLCSGKGVDIKVGHDARRANQHHCPDSTT